MARRSSIRSRTRCGTTGRLPEVELGHLADRRGGPEPLDEARRSRRPAPGRRPSPARPARPSARRRRRGVGAEALDVEQARLEGGRHQRLEVAGGPSRGRRTWPPAPRPARSGAATPRPRPGAGPRSPRSSGRRPDRPCRPGRGTAAAARPPRRTPRPGRPRPGTAPSWRPGTRRPCWSRSSRASPPARRPGPRSRRAVAGQGQQGGHRGAGRRRSSMVSNSGTMPGRGDPGSPGETRPTSLSSRATSSTSLTDVALEIT